MLSESEGQKSGKVLGQGWDCHRHMFKFDLKRFLEIANKVIARKQTIVSLLVWLFDSSGIISPVTVRVKILFQDIHGWGWMG